MTSWIKDVWAWITGLLGGVRPVRVAKAPAELVGLSIDYNWAKANHDKLCRRLAEAGLTGTSIEFGGWNGARPNLYDDGAEVMAPYYRSIVKACRRWGITLLVSLVNDNKGTGKYGDDHKKLDQFKQQIALARDIVTAEGSKNVWVQPVSETQTSYGNQLERELMAHFNKYGFNTVYNHGSRPTSPGAGSTFNAYHPFKTSDVGTDGDIVVTDTGTIIAVLTEGGVYGPAFNDQRVADYAAKVRKAGGRGLIIYGFTGVKEIDDGAIKALGKAWNG